MKYLLFTNFALWSMTFGVIHAVLFSGKASKAFSWDIHTLFDLFIVLTASMVAEARYMDYSLEQMCWLLIACSMSYSFWHNGAYYEGRYYIDVPSYNFFSQSTESTSKLELSFWLRATMFLIS